MTEPEKIEALKRAYAEMILNTTKEAAARVMEAELRAQRLEQSLVSTKEEAARMLLRLKRMIDVKSKEAAITSLNQQRKVNELESQLDEAEGIILDLRVELNQALEQLDVLKNKKLPSTIPNDYAQVPSMTANGTHYGCELVTSSLSLGPDIRSTDGNNSCLDWSTIDHTCCNPGVRLNSECVMGQIKEPELFRNGCTQRLCATQTRSMQEGFPVGGKAKPCNYSINIEAANSIGNTSVSEEKVQHGENEAVSVVRRSNRKRKLKLWDDVMMACGLRRSFEYKKPRQTC